MNSYRWLRLWTDVRTDRKLDTLEDDEFRVFVNLLCFAAEQPTRGTISGEIETDLLALEVARADADLLDRTVEALRRVRIVEITDDGSIVFRRFEDRNPTKPSDSKERVRERVRKHRESAKADSVTPSETPSNALRGVCNATEKKREEESREEKERGTGATDRPELRVVEVEVADGTVTLRECATMIEQSLGCVIGSKTTLSLRRLIDDYAGKEPSALDRLRYGLDVAVRETKGVDYAVAVAAKSSAQEIEKAAGENERVVKCDHCLGEGEYVVGSEPEPVKCEKCGGSGSFRERKVVGK